MLILKRSWLMILLALAALACGYLVEVSPTPTPAATATFTASPSATPKPTDTPLPTATLLPGIRLDTRVFETFAEHPQSTDQPNWTSTNGIVIPVEDYVGGVIFTVEEANGPWGGAESNLVAPEGSLMLGTSPDELPPGKYCVSDYFLGYHPEAICASIAPEYEQLSWIRPYFSGYQSEVGVAFSTGACDPALCTTYVKVGGIQLILYSTSE